ncbi:hypothetical protein CONLIGDRAFT_37949 [Coniochaeta ligniaria NRRL 30616]|uniref:Transcription factor domain-containing protein n=1 Tax=Coniochaeta ligniaria NRRL 30616 TaxID=1408157 RepID=A0A1J7JZZ7_9PEZI|nr:hypothetical protein CONLIGDRAFT_37949 [Coniochaeta ligniaria NRRL 30616]
MLVKTFVQHLYRFKGPLDGQPEPDNPFIDNYAPWCFQSRLLAPVALSVAATSLVQLRLMPSEAAMALKGQAIHTLNAYLRSPASATDEAISAVSQLILNDWYFGETRDMQAHLRGLRELVRLRGGFEEQSVNRLVSKTALLTDCFIAISLENSPLNVPEFIFHEPLSEKLNPAYNTPFVSEARYPSFGRSESLDLHPATAGILDDIRYLFSMILQLPPHPSLAELDKVQDTARLAQDSFEKMPDICPDAPRSSVPPSVIGVHSEASSSRQSASLSPPPESSSATASPTSSSDATNITTTSASSAPPIPQSRDPSHFILRNQAQSQPQHPPDFLYATVRHTALLYARAAATRTSLSTICPVPQFFMVWSMAFRVSLKEWHRRLGLFLWVIIAVLPTAGHTPFAALAKSLLHIGAVQVGLDHWEVAIEMLRSAAKVVGWLAGMERKAAVATT